MRLGEDAFTTTSDERVNPQEKGILLIQAGEFAVVTTHERIRLSARMAGHIGLRAHYAKHGLVILSGPQIDPGFEGVLVVGLCNLSPTDIVIPYKEPFCTVQLYRLHEEATHPYKGKYQGQDRIPADDIEALRRGKGMTFGEVTRMLSALAQEVSGLARSVKMLEWLIPAIVGLGIAVIAVIVGIK
jgi:dCTP deaminase